MATQDGLCVDVIGETVDPVISTASIKGMLA